ncbi:translation initiation factor IF-2 subunit alpha [archaeon SCG-AAA382B04]|nr:translation initiation factor IF-2 subunit alpha [archaeon SCG-AAA382B04]
MGELVVCTVTEVVDFGTFVELEEYGQKEGLIHISELASGWIKHVRDHVQEGQKVVCEVLEVDPSKEQINLSLKDVNEHQEREKIQEWKNEQKGERWLEFVAKKLDRDSEETKEKIGDKLREEYNGLLYEAFEDAALNGKEVLKEKGLSEEEAEAFLDIALDNVEIPYVEVTGFLELKSNSSDGVKKIKKALKEAQKIDEKNSEVEISYVGAPYYRIHIKAPDYKVAENILSKTKEKAINKIDSLGGESKFHREIEEEA